MPLLSDKVTLPGGGEPTRMDAPVELTHGKQLGQEEKETMSNDNIMVGGRKVEVTDECNPEHPISPIGTTTTAEYAEGSDIVPR